MIAIAHVILKAIMDNLPPTSSPLESALVRYRQALECLKDSKTPLSSGQVLEILSARDVLENVWQTQGQVSVEIISQVKQLDLDLKRKAYRITQVLSLPEHRASFFVPPQQWWWNLETTGEPHPLNRFDGLCQGLRGFIWTVDLGLVATLATRLLSGGSGLIEIVAIAVPSAIALFQVNNELTAKGQKQDNKHYRHEVIKLIPPVFLLIALGIVWHRQPQIAGLFKQEGYNHQWPEYLEQCQGQTPNPKQCRKQLVQAEKSYLKAIAFDSENLDANYNLGTLYEDLQDFENARKYYAIAAKGGLPDAYNNLARLYILQNKYSEAAILLNEGKALVDKLDQESEKKPENLPEVQYSLFKNLGWARLMQNNLDESEDNLSIALDIANDPEIQQHITNPGAVHCLLAQLKERQKRLKEALGYWQQCNKLIKNKLDAGEKINPEEDTWLFLAKQKLKSAIQGSSKP